MNLKNYTTEVSSAASIERIEKLLVNYGASNIMKEYSAQRNIVAISFIIEMNGMKLPFRLPAKVKEIFVWLKKKFPKRKDHLLLDQAERVCWKQIYEWTYIQLSLIELEQVEPLEAFFPFLYDVSNRETYYQKVKANDFKALLPAAN